MKYCSLQLWILLSPPDTSTTEHHFHFGPAASFFLELLAIALRSFHGVAKNWTQLSNFPGRQWHPTPVLLPGKSHGRRSLVGCSPWGHYESDTTERLHFHFHALEEEMATHSSILAWRIPGTGGLVGCHLWGRTESDTTEATWQRQQQSSFLFHFPSSILNTFQPVECIFWCHIFLLFYALHGKNTGVGCHFLFQ